MIDAPAVHHEVPVVTELERLQIEHACQRLSIAFANYVDANRGEELVALFANGGTFERAGTALTAPDQLRDFLAQRPTTRTTRHVCTNILIEVVDDANATGITYFTLFDHNGAPQDPPLPMNLPAAMGEYQDRYVRTDDGWRIAQRTVHAVYRR